MTGQHDPFKVGEDGACRCLVCASLRRQATWLRTSLGHQREGHCTSAQRRARALFDLDAAMAALPDPSEPRASEVGTVGVRLRGYLRADISEPLLREYAAETLGASRCSEQYLDALRVVLGNQADAERHGYVLELNTRVSFAPVQTMRTILHQMAAAGLTAQREVYLGTGRRQTIHYIDNTSPGSAPRTDGAAARELESMDRRVEAADLRRMEQARVINLQPVPDDITEADVPY